MTRPPAVLAVALALTGCHTAAPPAPALPSGPVWATVGDTCEYSTWTQTAGGRAVGYRFDWGDGDTSDWSEFVPGGTQVLGEHVWDSRGFWPVRSQAQGLYGARSEWSAALDVNVRPKPGYPDTPVATIDVGGRPSGIAVSPDGERVYVANCEDGDLLAIRTSDDSVIARVPDIGAWNLALSASGESLYMVDGASVRLVTTSDLTIRCTVDIDQDAWYLVLPPRSGQVWVSYWEWMRGGRIAVLQASDLTEVTKVHLDATAPRGMAASPDGRFVYVALSDVNAMAVVSTVDYKTVCRIPVGAVPVDAAISPDGRLAFTADLEGYSVTAIRTSDNAVLGSVPVGYEPLDVEFDPSGRYLYIACEDEYDHGMVVDVDRLVARQAAWKDARCVACLPDGSRLYAGGLGGKVTVFGFPNQD
ncbi:MAG: YncE family protein [candidate division WOR-3 bacterium]|nr:MAG: YncE family protein [candidate division WOR-3 bacterium]